MKPFKRLLVFLFFLFVPHLARAQTALSAAAANCTATSAAAPICLTVPVNANQGGATFTISANASANTIQFEASGDNGSSWFALNVTPSNSTTAVTSTTSTGAWQANVAGYTNVRMRMSTLVGGTTMVNINQSNASARAGGGGGSSVFPQTVSGATSGGIPCFTSSTNEASSAALPVNNIVIGGGGGACVSSEAFVPIAQTGSAGLTGTSPIAITGAGAISCATCLVTGAGPIASTTSVTATNPTINTDTQLMELSMAAGYFNTIKQPFLFQGSGTYNTTAAAVPALTFKIKLCTVSGCGSGTVVTLVNIVTSAVNTTLNTGLSWSLQTTSITNATGATGNMVVKGNGLTIDLGAATTTADTVFTDINTTTSGNIDLTAALFVDFTVAQSVAGATNAYIQLMGYVSPAAPGASPGVTVNALNTILINAIDCSAANLAGADAGATINNCITAAPAGGAITLQNMTTTFITATTQINVNKSITVYCGTVPVVISAPILLAAVGATWIGAPNQMPGTQNKNCEISKNANVAMFTLSASNTRVAYTWLLGNRATQTGDGIDVTTTGTGVSIDHNHIQGVAGIGVSVTGNLTTGTITGTAFLEDNIFTDGTTSAISMTGTGNYRVAENDISENTAATADMVIMSGAASTWFMYKNVLNGTAAHNTVSCTTNGTLEMTDNTETANGSALAGVSAGCNLVAQGNIPITGNPALSASSGLYAVNNQFSGNSNAIQIGANVQQTFMNNLVNWNPASGTGVSGVHVKGDSINIKVSYNKIFVNAGETPTGLNYGLWLDTSAGGHFIQGDYNNNLIRGASNANDVGIFFDNSTSNATASFNNIIGNSLVDMRSSGGSILRNDPVNQTQYYMNNTVNVGSIYSLAGSSNDVIVDANTLFASLPTSIGGGSVIFSSDTNCNGATVAGSGTGCTLSRANGAYVGIAGGNINVTSAVTGADYTNSTTTPSTVFTWTLPATASAKTYRYMCEGLWESTAATLTGPVFGVNIAAAPTQLTAHAEVMTAAAGTETTGYLSNTTTGSQTLITSGAAGVTTTNYPFRIWGTIEGAPIAGTTFLINAAALSSVTSTLNIRRGASCILN